MQKIDLLNHDMPVRDVMQKKIITAKFDTPLVDAISKMKSNNISGVVVVDNIGELLGVVSVLDIFKAIREGEGIDELLVEDIMTPFTITVHPEDTLTVAALTMMDNNIHRLVVTESPTSKKPAGIVTSTDLINNLL